MANFVYILIGLWILSVIGVYYLFKADEPDNMGKVVGATVVASAVLFSVVLLSYGVGTGIGDNALENSSQLDNTESYMVSNVYFGYPDSDSYITPSEKGTLVALTDDEPITYQNKATGELHKIDEYSKDVKVLITTGDISTVTVNTIKVKEGTLKGWLFNTSERKEYLFTIGAGGG